MKKEKKMLKTELAIVYLTTNNKKFLNIEDAIKHQGMLNENKEKEMEEMQMTIDIKNLVLEVFKENDWGVYFKGEPITSLPVQDNSKIYKVNSVSLDRFFDLLDDKIDSANDAYMRIIRKEKWNETQNTKPESESL
tara:strand:- start:4233 stop:4640 length:408 start_codon:yes stop_codon:yes gene_type:complete